ISSGGSCLGSLDSDVRTIWLPSTPAALLTSEYTLLCSLFKSGLLHSKTKLIFIFFQTLLIQPQKAFRTTKRYINIWISLNNHIPIPHDHGEALPAGGGPPGGPPCCPTPACSSVEAGPRPPEAGDGPEVDISTARKTLLAVIMDYSVITQMYSK